MAEAPNLLEVHHTSMSYIYKVFQHLDMPWMGIWVYPYTVTLVQVRVDFRKIGVGRSLSDVVMSWLRFQTHMESIVHPFHMYTKCFITLICHGWVYGCALTLLSLCRSGVDFRKIAVGQSLSDVAISWLRLQHAWIASHIHVICIHTQCFGTLICCGWAYGYGSTLTLLCLGRSGVDFRKIELCPSPSDVVMSWLRLQTCLKCIPHPCHIYTKCFNTLICHAWANGCILTLLRLCR